MRLLPLYKPYRFIPTPVGNTPLCNKASTNKPVHPHACGEHDLKKSWNKPKLGSSPRLWGTLVGRSRGTIHARFIPTPVGNTVGVNLGSILQPVHPHACGEHSFLKPSYVKGYGSSPRLWGTRLQPGLDRETGRFIPTPVGNTTEPLQSER